MRVESACGGGERHGQMEGPPGAVPPCPPVPDRLRVGTPDALSQGVDDGGEFDPLTCSASGTSPEGAIKGDRLYQRPPAPLTAAGGMNNGPRVCRSFGPPCNGTVRLSFSVVHIDVLPGEKCPHPRGGTDLSGA